MSEREQDQPAEEQDATGQGDESTDEWVEDVESDPSTAGPPDQPGEGLRGG